MIKLRSYRFPANDLRREGFDEAARRISVDIGYHAVCRESLGAVRRDGVAVVELPELSRFEADGTLLFAIHKDGHTGWLDPADGAHVTVRDAKLLVQRRELQPVARGKLSTGLAIDVHAIDTPGVVLHRCAVCKLHGQPICGRITRLHEEWSAGLRSRLQKHHGEG